MSKKRKQAGSRKAAKEFMDIDYWNKLSEEDKEYLTKFLDEYYLNYDHEDGVLPDDKESRKKQYRADNERRRDIWNNYIRIRKPVEALTDEDE